MYETSVISELPRVKRAAPRVFLHPRGCCVAYCEHVRRGEEPHCVIVRPRDWRVLQIDWAKVPLVDYSCQHILMRLRVRDRNHGGVEEPLQQVVPVNDKGLAEEPDPARVRHEMRTWNHRSKAVGERWARESARRPNVVQRRHDHDLRILVNRLMALDNVSELGKLPRECLILIKNNRTRGKRAANYQNVGMRLVILR